MCMMSSIVGGACLIVLEGDPKSGTPLKETCTYFLKTCKCLFVPHIICFKDICRESNAFCVRSHICVFCSLPVCNGYSQLSMLLL